MWKPPNKTGSATTTEASARPVGAKRPPMAGRALAVGFGPTARTRKRCRMTEAMASAKWGADQKTHRVSPVLWKRSRVTSAMASANWGYARAF